MMCDCQTLMNIIKFSALAIVGMGCLYCILEISERYLKRRGKNETRRL